MKNEKKSLSSQKKEKVISFETLNADELAKVCGGRSSPFAPSVSETDDDPRPNDR